MRLEYIRDPLDFVSTSLVEHARFKLLYHELAPDFEALIGRNSDQEARFVADRLSSRSRPARRVLDLGCGVGRITSRLADLCPDARVVGLDLSTDTLASRRLHNRASYAQGDMRRQPWRAGTFDAAVCLWSTYNYLSLDADRRAFFSESARVLKSGALLIVDSVWRPDGFEISETRPVEAAHLRGHLYIHKAVLDGLNVATYSYQLRNEASGEALIFIDQELCRMFDAEDISRDSHGLFDLESVSHGYDNEPEGDRHVCSLVRS